jgi:hypothetical protein
MLGVVPMFHITGHGDGVLANVYTGGLPSCSCRAGTASWPAG